MSSGMNVFFIQKLYAPGEGKIKSMPEAGISRPMSPCRLSCGDAAVSTWKHSPPKHTTAVSLLPEKSATAAKTTIKMAEMAIKQPGVFILAYLNFFHATNTAAAVMIIMTMNTNSP